MRSRNAILNLITSVGQMLFGILAGLVFPRLIIGIYGSEINGLTATITRILEVISLLQAGVVGASIYQMYKPVAEDDYDTQSRIISVSRRYYQKFTLAYVVLVGIVGFISSKYLANENIGEVEIVLAFVILAINGILNFNFMTYFDIFLSSHQRRYMMTIASVVGNGVHYVFLLLVLLGQYHFCWLYVTSLFGSIATLLVVKYYFDKVSGGRIYSTNLDYEIPGKTFLMISCVNTQILEVIPPIIITALIGLKETSVFAVYALVYTVIKQLLKRLEYSVSEIFGNLINSEKQERIVEVYDLLFLTFIVVGTFLSSCSAYLYVPFMKLYSAGFHDADYLQPVLAGLMLIHVCIMALRLVYNLLLTTYGLFKQMSYISSISSICAIVLSIVCVYLFGMPYVMVGIICGELIAVIVTTCILDDNVLWFRTEKLIQRCIVLFGIPFVMWTISRQYVVINTWLQWIVNAIGAGIVVSVIITIYVFLMEQDKLKMLKGYCVSVLKR